MSEPVFLGIADVLYIHEREIRVRGGSHGVRDEGLLASAVAMPQAGFGETYLHGDLFEMASAYAYHLVMNHPFIDGNKRTGLASALAFLDLNSFEIEMDPSALYDLIIGMCEGTVTKRQVADAFRDAAKPLAP